MAKSRARKLADFFGRQDSWSGVKSASTFLRGDGSWQQAGSTDAGDLTGVLPVGVSGGAGLAVSTASQTALDLKAPIASPTFTGTVGGIPATNAADIGSGVLPSGVTGGAGLDLVDPENIEIPGVPLSNSLTGALGNKADLDSPAFTGAPTGYHPSNLKDGALSAGVTGGAGLDAVSVGAANIGAGIFPADAWSKYDESRSRNRGTHKWHTRCASASPGQTFTLMRYSRWWWGNGFCRIQVHEYRYGPNGILGDFIIHGHTRNGNPGIHTLRNDGVPTPYFTDYDGSRERCQMKFGGASYREYTIEYESNGMTPTDTDALCGPNGGLSDCYFWHSQERIG